MCDGTDALFATFVALGIGAGDEVVLPANSFIATAEAVRLAGATPIFVDCDPATHLIDLASAERAVTPRTKAIAVIHLYGYMADMDTINALALSKNIAVVEDAAQAHGARDSRGRCAGSVSNAGCFSFYPTKNLGAVGEAGAVATNDDDIAAVVRAARVHGSRGARYQHDVFGANLKMDALQGAVLRDRLTRLDAAVARRRVIASRYNDAFASLPLELPVETGERHAFHLYVVATDKRDALKAHLESRGIGTGIHYPIAIPDQPAFASFGCAGSCTQATRQALRILSLPLFPEMRDEEINEVIEGVKSFFA